MDISSILTAYGRVRAVIDETHFDLVLDGLQAWAEEQELDLVIEIIPAKREVWYKIGLLEFQPNFYIASELYKQNQLNRILLNESTQDPVRIEITAKGIEIYHGAPFMENQCDDPEGENVEPTNP